MSTKQLRLNVSLRKDAQETLAWVARRDNMPQTTKAAELLEIALELEEDQVWDALAEKRDARSRYVFHDTAWD